MHFHKTLESQHTLRLQGNKKRMLEIPCEIYLHVKLGKNMAAQIKYCKLFLLKIVAINNKGGNVSIGYVYSDPAANCYCFWKK